MVLDTNGAGDVFHGAYFYSALTRPDLSWADHFDFARSASAFAVQRLGNEASLPTLDDINAIRSAAKAMREAEIQKTLQPA